jgi:hypothetical protein
MAATGTTKRLTAGGMAEFVTRLRGHFSPVFYTDSTINDGVASARDALVAAAADAIAAGGVVEIPAGTYLLDFNWTTAANFHFCDGAIISVASGVTLTISGHIFGNAVRHFSGDGTVDLGTAKTDAILPEWFHVGSNDWSVGIQKSIRACGAPNTSSTSNGRRIQFGVGQYLFSDPDTFTITSQNNLRFSGIGQAHIMGFKICPTELIFTGDGTDSPFHFTTNYSRGAVFEHLGLRYNNSDFTGNFVHIGTPGIQFINCLIGGTGITGVAPETVFSAYTLIYFSVNVESIRFVNCTLGWAQRAFYFADDITTGGPVSADGCTFYDVTEGFVEFESVITFMVQFEQCLFDPIYVKPTFGVRIYCHGFSIDSCAFNGTMTMAPEDNPFVDLRGSGFIGNGTVIRTNYVGLQAWACNLELGQLSIFALEPIRLQAGGSVYKQSGPIYINREGPGAAAGSGVVIGYDYDNLGGNLYAEIGPFNVNSGFNDSVKCITPTDVASSVNISGVLHYSDAFDSSTNGPDFGQTLVRVNNLRPRMIAKTGNYTITRKEYGCTFTNEGAGGAVTFTLPKAAHGSAVFFAKQANQNVVVQRAGSDEILELGANVTSLTNSAGSNINAELGVEGVFVPSRGCDRLRIIRRTGTWA